MAAVGDIKEYSKEEIEALHELYWQFKNSHPVGPFDAEDVHLYVTQTIDTARDVIAEAERQGFVYSKTGLNYYYHKDFAD